MPLPGADAVGEDVVFKTVCFLGREIAQEEGLQEAENRFLLPARILSRRLGCQEAEKAVRHHDERMVVHRMLLVNEGGDLVFLKRALENIRVIGRCP